MRIDPSLRIQPRRDLAMSPCKARLARERFWQARDRMPALPRRSLRAFQAVRVDDDGAEMLVARTGYTGEDGFEVMLPAQHAAPLWRDLLALKCSAVRARCSRHACAWKRE